MFRIHHKLFMSICLSVLLLVSPFIPVVSSVHAEGEDTQQESTTVILTDKTKDLTLSDTTLTDTFPTLSSGFEEVSLTLDGTGSTQNLLKSSKVVESLSIDGGKTGEGAYLLDSKVKVTTSYSKKNTISLSSGNKPIKQLITIDNPTEKEINLNLNVTHTITAKDNTFFWDGEEYTATTTPQVFHAYQGVTDINPQDSALDDKFKDIDPEARRKLPTISNVPTLRGTTISFKTDDNNLATYDFSDITNLDYDITIEQVDNQTILTLKLNNLQVNSHDSLTLDPTYDLADSANYNVRWDGAVASDYLTEAPLMTADLNGNGKLDLLVGASQADNNSRSNSGSLYIIYDSLIDDHPGVGQTVDLATSSNYNIRYDGAAANDYLSFGALTTAHLDNNGKLDLLVGTYATDNNSRSNSGSLYLIYDSLVDDHPGVGQTVDLATSSNYNIRYDGAAAGDYLNAGALTTADIDDNGKLDVLVGAEGADNNSRSTSGSLYVIYDSLIDDHPGVGQTVDLAISTNYNIRYDGAGAGDYLSYAALTTADLDGNGKLDILVGANYADNNSRSGSGSLYLIYDSLIDDHPGVGQTVDLATSSNFNIRYDGAVASDYLTYGALTTADLDGNGKLDLLVGASYADNNSRSTSGSLYVIYDSLIDDHPGVGQTVDLATSGNYNIRYDGAGIGDSMTYAEDTQHQFVADINGDGKADFMPWSPWSAHNAWAGSLYLLYNFPHTITLDLVVSPSISSTVVSGEIVATDSITNISMVQASLDNSTFAGGVGGWVNCTPTDGTFNSTSEAFSCSFSSLSEATHTVYVRAYDENVSYTALGHYAEATFSLAPDPTATPTTHQTRNPTATPDPINHPPSCDTWISDSEVPSIFEAHYVSPTQVSFSFVPVKGVDGYTIMYGTSNSSAYSARYEDTDSSGSLTYTINDLFPSDTWMIKIQAYKGCTSGPYSSDYTVRRNNTRYSLSSVSSLPQEEQENTIPLITHTPDTTLLLSPTLVPKKVSAPLQQTTALVPQELRQEKNFIQVIVEWVEGWFAH